MWTRTCDQRSKEREWRHPHHKMGMIPIHSKHYLQYRWKFEKFCKHFVIAQVRSSYEQGAIEEVVDNRLENEYNVSSVWKVVEIAMACVQREGRKRPTMKDVCNKIAEVIKFAKEKEPRPRDLVETIETSHVQPR